MRLWKESDQAEKNRRLAWEQEQEARLTRIHEENEGRLRTMQEEIDSLKEYIRHLKSATTVPAASQNSAPPHDPAPFQDPPQDHLSNQDVPHPLFVQGSSTDPTPYQGNETLGGLADVDENLTYTRKRTASPPSGDDESPDDDGLPLGTPRPNKRINGHDTRLLTIQVWRVRSGPLGLLLIVVLFEQHAMRSHLNRLMAVTEDGPLPPNHIEGAPLTDNEPVRFIWARTIKQSQHNTRMKKRVINDLIGSKELYEHVPQDDFITDNLDLVFDQTFATLRSKYKAQTDANIAQRRKEKEINKMIKTRRTNRKRAVSDLIAPRFRRGRTYQATRSWNCAVPAVRRTNLILTQLSMGLSSWNACLQKSLRTVLLPGINYSRGLADEHQSRRSFACGVSVGEALDWLNYSTSWTKPGRTTPTLAQLSHAGTKANRSWRGR